MSPRAVNEGRQYQGIDEQLIYTVLTTPWGGTPTSVSVVVKDVHADNVDVTVNVTAGSVVVVGDTITLPKIQSLTQGHLYRVEVKFTTSNNVKECFFEILAEL